MFKSDPEMLSAAETAERLGVTQQTVTRLARKGALRPLHVKPYMFDAAAVDTMRSQRREQLERRLAQMAAS